MTTSIKAPKTTKAPKILHLDYSQRVASTRKGRSDRLIVQTACGKGRSTTMTTDTTLVTCPACRATIAPVEVPTAHADFALDAQGRPAHVCACGAVFYGKTVSKQCYRCWKAVQAAKTSTTAGAVA
jgi:hypothetical protein